MNEQPSVPGLFVFEGFLHVPGAAVPLRSYAPSNHPDRQVLDRTFGGPIDNEGTAYEPTDRLAKLEEMFRAS